MPASPAGPPGKPKAGTPIVPSAHAPTSQAPKPRLMLPGKHAAPSTAASAHTAASPSKSASAAAKNAPPVLSPVQQYRQSVHAIVKGSLLSKVKDVKWTGTEAGWAAARDAEKKWLRGKDGPIWSINLPADGSAPPPPESRILDIKRQINAHRRPLGLPLLDLPTPPPDRQPTPPATASLPTPAKEKELDELFEEVPPPPAPLRERSTSYHVEEVDGKMILTLEDSPEPDDREVASPLRSTASPPPKRSPTVARLPQEPGFLNPFAEQVFAGASLNNPYIAPPVAQGPSPVVFGGAPTTSYAGQTYAATDGVPYMPVYSLPSTSNSYPTTAPTQAPQLATRRSSQPTATAQAVAQHQIQSSQAFAQQPPQRFVATQHPTALDSYGRIPVEQTDLYWKRVQEFRRLDEEIGVVAKQLADGVDWFNGTMITFSPAYKNELQARQSKLQAERGQLFELCQSFMHTWTVDRIDHDCAVRRSLSQSTSAAPPTQRARPTTSSAQQQRPSNPVPPSQPHSDFQPRMIIPAAVATPTPTRFTSLIQGAIHNAPSLPVTSWAELPDCIDGPYRTNISIDGAPISPGIAERFWLALDCSNSFQGMKHSGDLVFRHGVQRQSWTADGNGHRRALKFLDQMYLEWKANKGYVLEGTFTELVECQQPARVSLPLPEPTPALRATALAISHSAGASQQQQHHPQQQQPSHQQPPAPDLIPLAEMQAHQRNVATYFTLQPQVEGLYKRLSTSGAMLTQQQRISEQSEFTEKSAQLRDLANDMNSFVRHWTQDKIDCDWDSYTANAGRPLSSSSSSSNAAAAAAIAPFSRSLGATKRIEPQRARQPSEPVDCHLPRLSIELGPGPDAPDALAERRDVDPAPSQRRPAPTPTPVPTPSQPPLDPHIQTRIDQAHLARVAESNAQRIAAEHDERAKQAAAAAQERERKAAEEAEAAERAKEAKNLELLKDLAKNQDFMDALQVLSSSADSFKRIQDEWERSEAVRKFNFEGGPEPAS
ncbi:hypothetical protein RQP46_005893 [Phenoliferia psychrophenolica]